MAPDRSRGHHVGLAACEVHEHGALPLPANSEAREETLALHHERGNGTAKKPSIVVEI